jgi:hypothetical protein
MELKSFNLILFCLTFCLFFTTIFSSTFAASSNETAIPIGKGVKKLVNKDFSLKNKKIDSSISQKIEIASRKTQFHSIKAQKKATKIQKKIQKIIRKRAEKETGNGKRSAIVLGTGLLFFCLPLPYMLTTLGLLALIGVSWGLLLLIGGLFADRPWRFATQIFCTFVDIIIFIYSIF